MPANPAENPATRTIKDVIAASARTFGDKTAFQMLTQGTAYTKITYGALHDHAVRIAHFLHKCGHHQQDAVGIFAPNSPRWAVACAGVLYANGIVVPMDPKSGPVELEHMIGDAPIRIIFTTKNLYKKVISYDADTIILLDAEALPKETAGKKVHRFDDITRKTPNDGELPSPAADDVATIIYTSGTTSQPKGVMLTHRSILADVTGMLKVFPVDANDHFLSVIVLSHSYEFCCGLILPLSIGATITYAANLKHTTIFKNMQLAHPTVMYGVPMLFRVLLENITYKLTEKNILNGANPLDTEENELDEDAIRKAHQLLGGKMRYFVSGGAPLTKSLVAAFKKLHIPLLQVYGLTECSPVLTMTPPENEKFDSVGKALPGVELKIEPQEGASIGEICARGDNLMKGYHNNPDATAEAVRDGWLHTGDLGYLDSDGFLFVTGRSKNVIITSAGVNVYPEEIEGMLLKSPFVKDVAVIPKQRPDMTETVHAVVVADTDAYENFVKEEKKKGVASIPTLNTLIRKEIDRSTRNLADFKKVLDFQIWNRALPRGRTKKVVRNEVRREAFSVAGKLGIVSPDKSPQPLALVNANIITPFRVAENQCILVEGEKISQLGTFDNVYLPPNTRVIDLEGKIVTPGFIDLHVHGGNGYSFDTPKAEAFDNIADFFISHGTTHLLATLYVDEQKKFLKTIRSLAKYCKEKRAHSVIHGIHIEGPFINKTMKGALNEDYIWEPSIDNWLVIKKAGSFLIKMMTIAPEVPGALDVMQVAAQDGVVLSLGHSEARYDDIEIAIDNGLSQVTHIFNAMHPMHHRKPGVLVGALLKRELKVQLIADGMHVHPAVMELLYKLKGTEGILLVTDAIEACGKSDGTFDMAGQTITVRSGKAFLPDGTLAGSTITLEKAVKVLVEKVGIPITEAVRMASLNPARVLGLDHKKGVLAVGRDADMVVLDSDFEVEMTIVDGEVVFQKDTLANIQKS